MVGSLMDSRRMILLNSPHKETKNGAIATFKTDMARPLIDLIIDIKAVQAGSGDPSPENERPISGFNAVDVTRCRKNFFDKSATIQAYVDTSGNLISNAANLALNRFIPVKNGDIITLSSNATMFALGVALYDNNKTFIRRVLKTNDSICKLTANADGFILCSFNYNNAIHTIEEWSTIVDNLQIQLEFANERTAYTPYNGNTYNISWEDEVGTVYGGTLDVKNGILTATCQTIHKSISQGMSHPVLTALFNMILILIIEQLASQQIMKRKNAVLHHMLINQVISHIFIFYKEAQCY